MVSVSGMPGVDYWSYLREVDRILGLYHARVHWGKLHFLTKQQLHDRYPKAEKFIKIRKDFDPKGVFINNQRVATADDFNKKSAEQAASEKAMIELGFLSEEDDD